jgi:catechol 2,3-dioxygenase-like lactoylglutathione lyase family enzyme
VIDHVTIGASSSEASTRFYRTVLATLGGRRHDFSIAQAGGERPVTSGLHIGFAAPTHEHVDAFHRAGVEAGYRDDGRPGPRPEYGDDYYGGFLLDPDGNSAEAVFHDDLPVPGAIDHLWIRVRDREASRRFYGAIAPHAGFEEVAHLGDRTRFSTGAHGFSFTLVDGATPTAPFDLVFAVPDRATVEAFHATATRAGYRDDGAFVVDPDGHNVEAVHHLRGS